MSSYGKILARYLADTGIGAGFILGTMLVGTGLCRPGRGVFFVTKTITSWSLTMTITNGHLADNYVPE
jgi:hypothetical protein